MLPPLRRRWRFTLPLLLVTVLALLAPAELGTAQAAAGNALSLNQSSYTPGQNVVATYSTTQVSSTNWVGIYQSTVTPGSSASLKWDWAPNASGTVSLSTSSLSPGSYKAYLLANNGYTPLTTPVFFTVVSSSTTSTPTSMLCVGQGTYAAGQSVSASYATAAPSSSNWVAVYPDTVSQPNTSYLGWAYAPNASGTVSVSTSGLAVGNYLLYYLANNGYATLAKPARFSVAATATGPNLIVNGDGECGNPSASGYDAVTLPGWQITGVPTAVSYDAGSGFPSPSTPGPTNRGGQFFSGGAVGNSTLSQTANVASAGGQIDGGGVTYNLSGWLGGYAGETSWTTVYLSFRNGSGTQVGTAQLGPVSASDRGYATKLLQRTTTGAVPAGTRSIGVTVEFAGEAARNASNSYNDSYADNLSLTLSAPVPAPALPAPVANAVPQFDHVFFVMLENRSYDQVIGPAGYLTGIGNANVKLGQSYGAVHPSDPNYMAVAGGSTYGHVDNPMPGSIGALTGKHLGDLTEAAGKQWRGYIEDMVAPCNLKNNGYFDPDNMPFLFFQDVANNPARCQEHLHPVSQLWTDLQSTSTTPDFVWFEPNTCNTMHSCSTATGDTWFQNNLPKILNSPAWTQERSLIIITFDEDDSAHGQRVPTIVLGSQGTTKTGFTSNTHYTQYSMTRTIEGALGLPHLTQNDQYATPLNDIWR
ncbi:alkaline phosphatase family protein [Longispora sp. K20-0274]|uniref:alkaline phosphatase family protein n=1 Tax=Longispora sp. K20-0274 TaxID=3088255 RepID=UPI00399BD3F7